MPENAEPAINTTKLIFEAMGCIIPNNDSDMILNSMLLDHLTPKVQELLGKRKKIKIKQKYPFFWVKISVNYLHLRHKEDSRAIKVKALHMLNL